MIHLHPKPGIGRTAESFFKSDGHFRRDAAAPCNHVVKLLSRDPEALGRFGNTQAKIVNKLLDGQAGMRRVFHLHNFILLNDNHKIHIESVHPTPKLKLFQNCKGKAKRDQAEMKRGRKTN